MREHLITVLEDEAAHARASIPETAALVAARDAYVASLRASGSYVDGGRFRPSSEAKRVRREAGRPIVVEGPFGGEVLAGYHYVRAASLDEATAIARAIPRGPGDAVEVRPPMKANMQPDKDALPGKVFALAVLGGAANEAAWTTLMDRIDAETKDRFPDAPFVGGLRLLPPTTGRRIGAPKDGALVLDGPFVESREIIGGLFFLRLPSIDEAVRWAKETAFLTYGTLEIRELWRA